MCKCGEWGGGGGSLSRVSLSLLCSDMNCFGSMFLCVYIYIAPFCLFRLVSFIWHPFLVLANIKQHIG